MLGVSVSWAVAVDQTSASSRPYVGSSQTNSVLELAFGYNGMERLLGQETGMGTSGGMGSSEGMPSGGTNGQTDGSSSGTTDGNSGASQSDGSGSQSNGTPQAPPSNNGQGSSGTQGTPPSGQDGNEPGGTPPSGGGGPGGNGGSQGGGSKMTGSGGMFGTGEQGPLRLFQTALGDQISWFLPLALFGMLAIFLAYRNEQKKWFYLTETQKEMVFWAAWLVPVAGFFSVASFFHHYYLIMLAPAIAALAGTGLVSLYTLFRGNVSWKTYLLPASILLTGALQAFYVAQYSMALGICLAVVVILAAVLLVAYRKKAIKLTAKLTAATLAILLIAPTYWSLTPLIYGGNSSLPETGPQLATSSGGGFADASVDTGLINYLEENSDGETYLFGTTDATTAGPYIIKTKKSCTCNGWF